MDPQRFRVARYHGNQILCTQIEKARTLIAVSSAFMIRRIGRKSYIRALPTDLVRTLGKMTYSPISDDQVNDNEEEEFPDEAE